MKLSLQSKVAIFLALTLFVISGVYAYIFLSANIKSKENEFIARGTTFGYSLSRMAEEGLAKESLDLLQKASYIVQAQDVVFVQVYSNIWDSVDAYPIERLNSPPHTDAVKHFEESSSPFYIKLKDSYEFYNPVFFYVSAADSPQVIIGFVRIVLSSRDMQKEMNRLLASGIGAVICITLFAVAAIYLLIGRLVINPVSRIYDYVTRVGKGDLSAAACMVKKITKTGTPELDAIGMAISDAFKKLNRFREVIECAFDVIVITDSDGHITYANPAFETVTGYRREDIIGEKTSILKSGMHDEAFYKNLWDTITSGNTWKGEFINRKKSGEIYYVSTAIFPICAGDDISYVAIQRDITQEKKLYEQLLRSQKMEAIGTLAGGVAHDFNNILTAILGYSEIMLDGTKEEDPFHKPSAIINKAAQKGADLAKRLLMVSRKEKMEAKPVNINEIIQTSIELLQRSIPKNIEIVVNLKKDIPQIMADPSQMQQVIMNLAVNARDAMPEGGKLIIETSLVGEENGAANSIPAGDKGGFIKLSISDTGHGMDMETQSRIFDPFFTTKETGKGTGLGLYIVHSVISNHGGYINIYSEVGKGTRFNIYLPITKAADTEESVEAEDMRGSGTILVIDDEADIRQLCKDMLEPLGYKVMLAESGSEGINLFRAMKDEISIVIVDMIMPKMGGSEVFQALKTIKPDIKIILCSGYSHEGFAGIDKLLKSGAAGFVQKPFTRHSIAQAIKKALSE